ncbi:MAG: hypothetical protein MUO42_10240 [Anaerolineaceae bacterium]|nr:hypothetical protein [Anaerolineaceae bacterium]
MRRRYIAIRGFSWIIPTAIGLLGAGLIRDNVDPRILWNVAGFTGMLSTLGFTYLNFKAGKIFEEMSNGNSKNGRGKYVNQGLSVEPDKAVLTSD